MAAGPSAPALPLLGPAQSFDAGASDSVDPLFSADGRYLFFQSWATDLESGTEAVFAPGLFRYDTLSETLSRVKATKEIESIGGLISSPSVSSNGEIVSFAAAVRSVGEDAHRYKPKNVYWKDLRTDEIRLMSVAQDGISGGNGDSENPVLSPDGHWLAFESTATNLIPFRFFTVGNAAPRNIFIRETGGGPLRLINPVRNNLFILGSSYAPSLSSDGQRVAFVGDGLPAGDKIARVYVWDNRVGDIIWSGTNYEAPTVGFGKFMAPQISADGRWVSFLQITTLQQNNTRSAIVLHDLETGADRILQTNWVSCVPIIPSEDSSVILFERPNQLCFWNTFSENVTSLNPPLLGIAGQTYNIQASADRTLQRIAYLKYSSNRVDGQSVSTAQLYLYDAGLQQSRLVSTNRLGEPAHHLELANPVISQDGRFIAFQASDGDLSNGDKNQAVDVFLHDLTEGRTQLISHRHPDFVKSTPHSFPVNLPCLSSNGAVFAFSAMDGHWVDVATNNSTDLFTLNMQSGTTTRVTGGPGVTANPHQRYHFPQLSHDGRFMAFAGLHVNSSDRSRLAPQLYFTDRSSGALEQIPGLADINISDSLASRVRSSFYLSPSGKFLAFLGVDPKYFGSLQIILRDLTSRSNQVASLGTNDVLIPYKQFRNPWVSKDGSAVLYLSDGDGLIAEPLRQKADVYRLFSRNMATHQTRVLSRETGDTGSLVASGSIETYTVNAAETVVAYRLGSILDRPTIGAWIADIASGTNRYYPQVQTIYGFSADGRYAIARRAEAASSGADALGRLDTWTGELLSFPSGADWGGNFLSDMNRPLISADGRFVVFQSSDGHLAPGDKNGASDIFVRDMTAGVTFLASANAGGSGSGNGPSATPLLGDDGRTLLFRSWASDLIAGDANNTRDWFRMQLTAPDSDGDGIPDDWEWVYFNTLDRDGTGDFDSDGLSDAKEYAAGTDPTNQQSVLRVLTLQSIGGSTIKLLWGAVPGKDYEVQRRSSVSSEGWETVGHVHTSSSSGEWEEATSPDAVSRFYRVRIQ